MSRSVLKNYWPSLLLSSVLIAGLIVCLKRIDCLAIEEVNAFITILFGSATSCLLLTFIWFSQHKNLHRPWPNQGLAMGRDMLSMHPRGRTDSLDPYDTNRLPSGAIATITIEQPPSYEDALTNSKPLYTNWSKKEQSEGCIGINIKAHQQQDSNNNPQSSSSSPPRKVSYLQLDVGQLMLSSSPPKYCELQFNNYLVQSSPRASSDKKSLG